MTITLTQQQLQELEIAAEGAPRFVDPRDNTAYILVAEADYATVREILEDERYQRLLREKAIGNAAGRMEDIP